jgi:hypothetical protein
MTQHFPLPTAMDIAHSLRTEVQAVFVNNLRVERVVSFDIPNGVVKAHASPVVVDENGNSVLVTYIGNVTVEWSEDAQARWDEWGGEE